MNKVKILLREEKKKVQKDISDDSKYLEYIEHGCLSYYWAETRLRNNKKYLIQLNKAIKILNKEG